MTPPDADTVGRCAHCDDPCPPDRQRMNHWLLPPSGDPILVCSDRCAERHARTLGLRTFASVRVERSALPQPHADTTKR